MSAFANAALALAELYACRSDEERARITPRLLDALAALPRASLCASTETVEADLLDGLLPDAGDVRAALRTVGHMSLAAAAAPASRPCVRPPASATALTEEHAAASARTAVVPSAGAAEEADPVSQTEPCAAPEMAVWSESDRAAEVVELDLDGVESAPLPLVRQRGTVFAPALFGDGGL